MAGSLAGLRKDFKVIAPQAHILRQLGCLIGALAALLSVRAAASEPPRRVVSINLCTDQLLIGLAAPGQIAAVSRLARHPELSFLWREAATIPIVRGAAEEVLALKPDLVLAGAFSGTAARTFLAAKGLRVETFPPATTIGEARAEIARAAKLLGREAKGVGLLTEIARATAAAQAVRGHSMTALALERRGFASGKDTLLSDLMAQVGLTNAAARIGIVSVDRAPLEVILAARPDVLIVEEVAERAPDQGTALLRHPALARSFPPERTITLPVAEVTCGGPALPTALRRLADAVHGK